MLWILVCRVKFKECLDICHRVLHLFILFVINLLNHVDQSNSVLVRNYHIPSTVCFKQQLHIRGAVLQTQIVDICIDLYPCDFLCSDLLALYHILVNFHHVYLIINDWEVSSVQ